MNAGDTDADFQVAQTYLDDLQAGRPGSKEKVLRERPDLAALLDCLEALEKLAPPRPDEVGQLTLPFQGGHGAAPTLHEDFGDYILEAEIGRGGMGVVYRARHKGLCRLVALKMILANHLASDDLVTRFHTEARAAASLQHPHIVAVYEAGHHNGQPFFAMQFVDGPSLAAVLHQGILAAEDAARIVKAVALAVHHLHQHGIVHRDLKPSNILLDSQRQPYVTDFGLVKMLAGDSQRTSTGVIVGTPSYMAPEQAAGRTRTVGPLSDIYSLGAILYEALTGRPPFREETPLDTLVQVLESEPTGIRKLVPAVPAELEAICLRCLEKAPEDRYPTALALAQDLERNLKGEDIELKRTGLGQRLRRWARREPALVSRLGTLGACGLVAQLNYHLTHQRTFEVHLEILGILVLWCLVCFALQKLLDKDAWAQSARVFWMGADVLLFTTILWIDRAFSTPLVVGYPLLIAASGLWFRAGLVWTTTLVAELSYIFLLWQWVLEVDDRKDFPKHVVFLVGMVMLASMVVYQVNRVRALSRYYEHRQLP